MTTKLTLLALLALPLSARPPVEPVPDQAMPHLIAKWHHDHKQAPQPIRATVNGQAEGLEVGDVLLWETYTGQTISAGDLFIADYPTKNLTNAVRLCAKVDAATITTLAGTTIPLTQVRGIVRRVVRVTL